MSESNGKRAKKPRIIEYLSTKAELPSDAMTGSFLLEIRGRNVLFIQGCRRIIKYSSEHMILAVKGFEVSIAGERLICSTYHDGTVSIEGYVNSVQFHDGYDEDKAEDKA